MSVQIDGSTGNIIAIKADYSGDVSIGGTLTYEDVTNIDAVGLITARNGIKVDDLGVQVGTGATIDGATNTLTFLTNGSERLRVHTDGNVLLGTTSNQGSSRKLQVAATDSSSGMEAIRFTTSAGSAPSLTLSKSNSDTLNANTLVDSDDSLGYVQFKAANGSGYNTAAQIVGEVDGTPGVNDMPGRLVLSTTADGASTPTERLRITSDGKVGVNQSTPQTTFHSTGTTNGQQATFGIDDSGLKISTFQKTDNDAGVILDAQKSSNGTLTFATAGTERLRIDSGGAVGVGIANPGDYHVNARDLVLANGMTIANSTTAHMYFADSSTGTGEYVGQLNYQHANDRFQFVVGNTARALLLSSGDWATLSTAVNLDLANTQSAGINEAFIYARHSSTQITGGTLSFRVYTNGNVQNTNNSYGSTSDRNLKENIVDATSQWDDIKALQVRKYNFRENTGHQTHTQLGLIAQEVETVSPGLVETTPVKEGETVLDAGGNQLESIKSINYSVLYMKAVKALQEAQTRIETLETKVAALEG